VDQEGQTGSWEQLSWGWEEQHLDEGLASPGDPSRAGLHWGCCPSPRRGAAWGCCCRLTDPQLGPPSSAACAPHSPGHQEPARGSAQAAPGGEGLWRRHLTHPLPRAGPTLTSGSQHPGAEPHGQQQQEIKQTGNPRNLLALGNVRNVCNVLHVCLGWEAQSQAVCSLTSLPKQGNERVARVAVPPRPADPGTSLVRSIRLSLRRGWGCSGAAAVTWRALRCAEHLVAAGEAHPRAVRSSNSLAELNNVISC